MRSPQKIPVVRARGQFGPMPKEPESVRLFLDDARNPPLNERGWVIVRTVEDGFQFLRHYGKLVTEVSLDNDLGPDPQGYMLLDMILRSEPGAFPQLKKFTIHTGNMPKWRLMVKMLRGKGFIVERRVPTDLIYPRASKDTRKIEVYKHE